MGLDRKAEAPPPDVALEGTEPAPRAFTFRTPLVSAFGNFTTPESIDFCSVDTVFLVFNGEEDDVRRWNHIGINYGGHDNYLRLYCDGSKFLVVVIRTGALSAAFSFSQSPGTTPRRFDFQTITSWSAPPLLKKFPSGEKHTEFTAPLWPCAIHGKDSQLANVAGAISVDDDS